jgi:ATP-dependent DNA helicase PIF1
MNKYKRWSEDDNNILLLNITNNIPIDNIANILERSKYALLKQLEKLLLQKGINCQKKYEDLIIDLINDNFNKDNIIKDSIIKERSLIIEDNHNLKIKEEINYLLDDIINEIEETANLNDKQKQCYNLAKNKQNILITGAGGSGKSMSLKSIIKYFKRKSYNIGVTSTTGSSATLINGTTIHSFLNIGLANKSATELYEKIKFKSKKSTYNKLKKLDVLIIDEISMMDDILFNKIGAYLSLIKEIKKPFGKIQLILCGDFYQLSPINNDYCFKSNIWNMLKIKIIELKQLMRQTKDLEFQELLYNIKINNITDDVYNKLKARMIKPINTKIQATKLYSRNIDIDQINKQEFNKLVNLTNAKIYKYEIKYDTNNSKISKYIDNSNITKSLELCIGAQIMLTSNIDIINNLVNGTRGVIKNMNNNFVIIETVDGKEHNIEYVKFINDLDENITFSYMPIRLSYAVSIHRSQGMTIDLIDIDLGNNIFGSGMAYVALSRARSLDTIYISKLSRNAFKINSEVIEFYKQLR